MTQEWCCAQGHRWQHPTTGDSSRMRKFDECPICGGAGAPAAVAPAGERSTRQVVPADSDATLPPKAAPDHTLVGSSNEARGAAVTPIVPVSLPPDSIAPASSSESVVSPSAGTERIDKSAPADPHGTINETMALPAGSRPSAFGSRSS